jgi:hypothetical protein
MLCELAQIKRRMGDYLASCLQAFESQRLAKVSADLYREADALRVQCLCWDFLGQYSHVISLAKQARNNLKLCGMSRGAMDGAIMTTLAEVHRAKSEYVDARNIHIELLLNLSSEQEAYQSALALTNIALIDVEIGGSKQDVQEKLNTAQSLFTAVDFTLGRIFCDLYQAFLEAREGDLLTSRTHIQQCLALAWGKDTEIVTECLQALGDFNLWSTMNHSSQVWTVTFLAHSLKQKQKLQIWKALQFMGDTYLVDGDEHTSISLFTLALEGFTKMDVHRGRAECMLHLGDISHGNGDIAEAAELWTAARPLFERSSQAKQIVQVDDRLAGIRDQLLVIPPIPAASLKPTLTTEAAQQH